MRRRRFLQQVLGTPALLRAAPPRTTTIPPATFGPNALDATFGPEPRFVAIPPGMKPNRPPSAGLQFFGTLGVEGRTRVLTARLHDLSGKTLFQLELPPQR